MSGQTTHQMLQRIVHFTLKAAQTTQTQTHTHSHQHITFLTSSNQITRKSPAQTAQSQTMYFAVNTTILSTVLQITELHCVQKSATMHKKQKNYNLFLLKCTESYSRQLYSVNHHTHFRGAAVTLA